MEFAEQTDRDQRQREREDRQTTRQSQMLTEINDNRREKTDRQTQTAVRAIGGQKTKVMRGNNERQR